MQTDGRAALLAVLATLVAITVATNTTASLAQPQIGSAFDAGPADTAWVVFGYSATFAVGTALWGGIASRTGLIPALVAGVSLLGVGSMAAAIAPSLELVIGARLVQGLGSGAIPTLATALIAGRFDGADRARALGVIIAAVGGGQALGPLLGGVLLEFGGWRPAVSIGVVAIPAVVVLARSQRGRSKTVVGHRRIDWPGAALVAAVALSLTFVLNRGPLLGAAPIVVGLLAVGVVAALALVRRAETHDDAFVPGDVLRHPVFRAVVPLGALGLSSYIGTIVLVPILGARAYGLDGIALGLLLLPMAVAAAVSSPNNARVQAWIGPMATTRLALALLGGAPILIGLAAVALGPALLAAGLVLLGTGFGLLNAPLLSRLTHAIAGDRQPVAVGIYNLCFFLGGAVGASISSAIVQLGVDLPWIASGLLPGFSTALLLVGIGPLIAAALVRAPRADDRGRYPPAMTLPRPSAVIFDLDGTLVDTVPARIDGWEATFLEHDIPATREQLAPLIGIDGRRLAREVVAASGGSLDDATAERIDRRAGQLFDEANRRPRPLPGSTAALARLNRAGVTWAIATSSRAEQVEASLAALTLGTRPRIVDGSRVEHAKPAPDLLLLAARELEVDPPDTWYVGDSTWDMRAAEAAGMVPVAVRAGAAVDAAELRAAGAAVVLETLDELVLPD